MTQSYVELDAYPFAQSSELAGLSLAAKVPAAGLVIGFPSTVVLQPFSPTKIDSLDASDVTATASGPVKIHVREPRIGVR